jgi:hypothetical protein
MSRISTEYNAGNGRLVVQQLDIDMCCRFPRQAATTVSRSPTCQLWRVGALVGHVLIFRRGSLLMGWQPTALAVIWFGGNSSSHGPTPGVHTGQMPSRMTVHSLWITFHDLRTRTHGHEYTLASWAKPGRDWSNQGRSVLGYAFPALVTLPRCQPLVASCRICFKPTAGMLNDPG